MRRSLAGIVALAVAVAGCGSSGGGKGRTVTVKAGGSLTVTAREYKFDPKTIDVTAAGSGPATLNLTLVNKGSLAHDLRVRRNGQDMGGTGIFESGSQSTRLTLPRGTYQFECTVGDHATLGMKGTLVVR